MVILTRYINILKKFNPKDTFRPFSTKIKPRNDEEIAKKRAEVMSKGLPKQKPIPGVKNIIVVSSGKGGVGKSTTSVNLAVGIKAQNPQKQVGLLDADVFGPTIPLMMNLHDTPLLNDHNLMEPLENYGVKCMSMGFLISEGAPVVWRGLMVMQALQKLMRQVAWGQIDYLIVDTPPGTGDTHLSLAQNLPITGALLVTTPQTAAVEVTKRGAVMYEKLKVPVVGIVENMSSVKCPACLNDVQLFGNASQQFSESMGIDLVARVPLEKEISSGSDNGVPIVIGKPKCGVSLEYFKLGDVIIRFCDNKST
ncbi:iron-sulfur cluster transfer protein NUBPL [Onthophagus taurus]|uniref:iron-sulfur cluster transfer protein NUBPL n=1 Tax=Onthophagus taurus TaxID=166361 RepID=UPI000C20BB1A|nr:iron-sulfur protein NUBPL [Onthophagus taurus]